MGWAYIDLYIISRHKFIHLHMYICIYKHIYMYTCILYIILYYIIIYYTILYYTLYYIILQYIILYYIISYHIILYYIILYCVKLYYIMLYITIYYTMLYVILQTPAIFCLQILLSPCLPRHCARVWEITVPSVTWGMFGRISMDFSWDVILWI